LTEKYEIVIFFRGRAKQTIEGIAKGSFLQFGSAEEERKNVLA